VRALSVHFDDFFCQSGKDGNALCWALTAALGGCAGSAYSELLSVKQAKKPIFASDMKAGRPDKKRGIAVTALFNQYVAQDLQVCRFPY
jgi:hypothetical protein